MRQPVFFDSAVEFRGAVHLVWNSVHERSSRFARCGVRIPDGVQYENEIGRANCPYCIRSIRRHADRALADAR